MSAAVISFLYRSTQIFFSFFIFSKSAVNFDFMLGIKMEDARSKSNLAKVQIYEETNKFTIWSKKMLWELTEWSFVMLIIDVVNNRKMHRKKHF